MRNAPLGVQAGGAGIVRENIEGVDFTASLCLPQAPDYWKPLGLVAQTVIARLAPPEAL